MNKKILLAALLLAATNLAQARDNACMIEGEFNLMGTVIKSRDCMQTSDKTPEAQFKQSCEALAQTSAQLGGKAGKVTYSETCPKPAQGICKNFMRSGNDAYYYERDAEDLAGLPKGCGIGGGTWASGK